MKNYPERFLLVIFRVEKSARWQKKLSCIKNLTLKDVEGGGIRPLPHFLLYLCRLLFFRAETSWLFSFKPCTWFKTIFIKAGHRVMTLCCVIARWVQRKTDFPIENYTQIVFFVFFVFQDTLPLCFILIIWFIWSKNMCKAYFDTHHC